MTYPNLFKARYPVLKGKNWLQTIDADDRRAFVEIGHKESDYGRKGGLAVLKRYGKEHFVKLAKMKGRAK